MTTEELKAHRRAICEALIEGKQCQALFPAGWFDCQPETAAAWVFRSEKHAEDVRIKPEPRKVWIGWPKDKSNLSNWVTTKNPSEFEDAFIVQHNWQLVEEPE